MAEGLTVLSHAFVGQGQIVVGVGVAGRERNGLEVSGDGFVQPLQLVEDVAEIEEGQHVAGIGRGGAAV